MVEPLRKRVWSRPLGLSRKQLWKHYKEEINYRPVTWAVWDPVWGLIQGNIKNPTRRAAEESFRD